MRTKSIRLLLAASSVFLSSSQLVHADQLPAASNTTIINLLESSYGQYLSLADDQDIVSGNGAQVANATISNRKAAFDSAFRNALSPQLQAFYSGYVDRVRKSSTLIDRIYTHHETTWTVNGVNISGTTATVQASEFTKMYYHSNESPKEDYEAYVYDHTFTFQNINGKWTITEDVVPGVYDSNTTVWDDPGSSGLLGASKVVQVSIPAGATTSATVQPMASIGYVGANAAAYAEQWWDSYNPSYWQMPDDCTNFVSQAIEYGINSSSYVGDSTGSYQWWNKGLTAYGAGTGWSYSYTVASDSFNYWLYGQKDTTNQGLIAPSTTGNPAFVYPVSVGDPVYYDWTSSGTVTHAAIVVGFNGSRPYVDQHSNARYHQDFTGYPNNTNLTTQTVWFVHIKDWNPTD